MTTSLRRAFVSALSLVALAACDRTPAEPLAPSAAVATVSSAINAAEPERELHPTSVTGNLTLFGCAWDDPRTELVRLEGEVMEATWSVFAPNGVMLFSHRSLPAKLAGVGIESGDQYEVTTTGAYVEMRVDGGLNGTNRDRWTLVNTRTGDRYSVEYLVRFKVDEFWNVVVYREIEQVQCPN